MVHKYFWLFMDINVIIQWCRITISKGLSLQYLRVTLTGMELAVSKVNEAQALVSWLS